MKKITSFILGTVIGGAAGFLAGSLFVTDNQIDELKQKVKNNDTVQDLKKKYDNGTEIVKNQLSSFPKDVDDDSEIKDFDDIVIDDSSDDSSAKNQFADSVDDLQNAENPSDLNNKNESNHPEDKVVS
jgi:gas vesicle protein